MSATTCMGSPTVRPVRSWADMVEAYRPVVESKSSWARTRRPKVSLCISAFQAKRDLKTTIDSCLAQRDVGLELVIIDNNSSGGTQDILESVNDDRVRIIRSATTVSLAEDFNVAVQQSDGRYVKLVCAGDTLHPDCIAEQAKVLEGNADVALVAVQTDRVDDEGNLLTHARGLAGLVGRHSAELVIRRIVRSSSDPIDPPVSGLFRRVDFDRCGGCRGDLLFPMDMGLWVRLLGQGDFIGVPVTLASSRIGSCSTTELIRRSTYRTPTEGASQ
jgi:glycosyltransferase involved in cell wall biosynthesis